MVFKAGVGVGLLVLTTLAFFVASSCDNCDSSTISASGTADQLTTATEAQAEPEQAGGALTISPDSPVSPDPLAGDGAYFDYLNLDIDPALAAGTPAGEADGETTDSTVEGEEASDSSGETESPSSDGGSTGPVAAPPSDGGEPPVNGSVFYVSSGSGNDGNDGLSQSSPWKSLQTGIKRLQAGQTLLVMDGEYRELKSAGQVHYSIDRGGSSDNWIRIANAPGHSPVIVATNGSGVLIQAPYVEVAGLTIRGSGFNESNNWGVGISVTDTHNVRVVGNRISQMPVSGISVVDSDKFDIIGNEVFNNSFWSGLQGSGISVWHARNKGQSPHANGYHNLILGNRVHGNENKVPSTHKNNGLSTDGNGIIVDETQETGYSGRTLIANNVVFNNGGRGIIAWKSDRVDIMFNTAYQNGQTDGIMGGATEFAAGRANDVTIANNVGWARSGLPALILDSVSNGETYGNILVTDSPSGNAGGSDRMYDGNPGFRNATTDSGSADFRPASGSVLIGASNNAASFIGTDLVGTNRRNGTPDVGAFEAEASRR